MSTDPQTGTNEGANPVAPAPRSQMDKHLRPERLDCDPNSPTASKRYKHWLRTFTNFIRTIDDGRLDRLDCLINYVSSDIFDLIADCDDYDEAKRVLDETFLKPVNEIYNRHVVITRRQVEGETLDQYYQTLVRLSKDCHFKAVTAEVNRQEYVRDAFINGLSSCEIRRRLLENNELSLDNAFKQARSLELAQRHSADYVRNNSVSSAAVYPQNSNNHDNAYSTNTDDLIPEETSAAASNNVRRCYFCHKDPHDRSKYPAKKSTSRNCSNKQELLRTCDDLQFIDNE